MNRLRSPFWGERRHARIAHLEGANLRLAVGLTTKQLSETFGDAKTRLPKDVQRPAPGPLKVPEAAESPVMEPDSE